MRVYVNKKTGVEVLSPFVICGDDWREVTPAESPLADEPAEKPAGSAKQKAVKKSGGTVRKQK